MNWDWDKLQENRKRQKPELPSPPEKKGTDGNSFGEFNNLKKFLPGLPLPIIGIIVLLWLASGIFTVHPGEQGVVLRFGKYDRTVQVGPHYRLPFPIESSIILNADTLQTVEIGVSEKNIRTASAASVLQSTMYTGDENIIHVQCNVQYTISDAASYLFNVQNPTSVIENAAEAAMREVIGQNKIEAISNQEHQVIEAMAMEIITNLLNSYNIGVKIHAVHLGDVYPPLEVKEAFIDVSSAKEAMVTIENNAKAYRAEIVPVASGSAKSIVNSALAYSETIVKKAEGEATRFTLMAKEFNTAKEVTKKRLYLEMMEEVLSSQGIDKIIISPSIKGSVVPYLNLNEIAPTKPQPTKLAPSAAQPAETGTPAGISSPAKESAPKAAQPVLQNSNSSTPPQRPNESQLNWLQMYSQGV